MKLDKVKKEEGKLLSKVVSFCKKFELFEKGDKVGLAVSGGKDSVFLLHFFVANKSKFGVERDEDIVCLHFNHKTRGAESDKDEKFVLELCGKLGVRCEVGRAEKKLESEDEMRRARYEFFDKVAGKLGLTKVVTAHTLDDQLETFLIKLMRGSSVFGAVGILPKNEKILRNAKVVRPLLVVRRKQILRWLDVRKITWREDLSNKDPRFLRNRIRQVLEKLDEDDYERLLSGFERFWFSLVEMIKFAKAVKEEFESMGKPLPSPEIQAQIELFEKKGEYSFEELKRKISEIRRKKSF